MKIRAVTSDDFGRICELLQQLWPGKRLDRNALKTVMNRALQSPQDVFLCAEVDTTVVGFCSLAVRNSLWLESRLGILSEMIVDEAFRNRGIGTALLGTIIDMGRQRGCRRIELDSAFHREKTHHFYEKAGFAKRAYLFSKELY